ncbi:hypothetical protein JL720_2267 [Aureococcus anophagefferens]|nr:hypothetical protein JL720_2267 [Aureococcus anophagefferens]
MAGAITLTTRGRVAGMTAVDLHRFLATPANWPDVVASSVGVEGPTTQKPLTRGASVDELFGLPPILPLSVTWTCAAADERSGVLDVRSPDGLEGVASDCRMLFDVRDDADGAVVDLEMSYEPAGLLATLRGARAGGGQLLGAERAVDTTPKIDKFRDLMGALYGVAGVAHAADCLAGPSDLLTLAGAPPFYELPALGQAFALLWCLSGPAAYACARVGGRVADAGLVQYGAIECAGAGAAAAAYGGASLPNALAVQAVVGAAWVFSNSRDDA